MLSAPLGATGADHAVITPSYAPDVTLFRELHRSVAEMTDALHYVVVPDRDVDLFDGMSSGRLRVVPVSQILPRRVRALPRTNGWVNLRHPLPPIRGWMMQQIVKLSAPDWADAEVLVFADSDVELVRPLEPNTLRRAGIVRFYRNSIEVDAGLPRHVQWHQVARSLLGLGPSTEPLRDYISAFNIWDSNLVRSLRLRIEDVAGKPWIDAVGAKLHFSEYILYGLYLDEVVGPPANANTSNSTLCHSYWDARPMDDDQLADFVSGMPDEDVAVMISAKSSTPMDIRRRAVEKCASRLLE